MAEAMQVSHPEVTNNTGKVERVVDSTIASTTTLQPGTVVTAYMLEVNDAGRQKLAERINEAYSDELEPEERELLDHAAEQFGRRISSEE